MLNNLAPLGGWLATVVSMVVLLTSANPCQAEDKIDVTGTWYSDGNVTSMRQVGSEVWWVSKSADDDGKTYTASGHGNILGKELIGTFADLPGGANTHSGTISLDLVMEDGKVVKMSGRLRLDGGDPTSITLQRDKKRD